MRRPSYSTQIKTVLLLLVLCAPWSHAARRNLSEITYRFTTCGSNNYNGPNVNSMCLRQYEMVDSPIVADEDSFFQFEDNSYKGAQGFRVPKDDLYNVTIAGAAGGKGVCNFEYGHGGVVSIQVKLTTDYEYLILVGQRGASVCDANPNHPFCMSLMPPTNIDEARSCNESWYNWTASLPSSLHYLTSGGGGGGGASMVWPRRRNDSVFTDLPLAIGPGGGGASAVLDYIYLAELLSNFTTAQYPRQADDMNIYRYFINAHLERFLSSWPLGARGNRPDGPNVVTSGSGGGWTSDFSLALLNVDGKLLSQRSAFAEGGFDCSSRVFTTPDQTVIRDVFGGFGGGGGGCGSGGAGGGYTGGLVPENVLRVPGGGGDVGLFPNQIPNFLYNYTNTFLFNDGEGYVEIIPASCTCTGVCVVYPEDREFECFCPNETTLAPDGSSCYEESNVTVNNEDPLIRSSGGESYIINGLLFENRSVSIFSLDVALSLQPDSMLPRSEEDVACAVVFVGHESQSILASNPVKVEGGRANQLTILGSGTVEVPELTPNYTSFLSSPVLVTGALLLTNGNCTLIGPLQMNISIGETTIPPIDDLNLSNGSLVAISARQILQIQVPATLTTSLEPDSTNDSLTIGLPVAVICLLLVLIGIVALVIVYRVIQAKRGNKDQKTITIEIKQERELERDPICTLEHIYEDPDRIDKPPLPSRNIRVNKNLAYDKPGVEIMTINSAYSLSEQDPVVNVSEVQRCSLEENYDVSDGMYDNDIPCIPGTEQATHVE